MNVNNVLSEPSQQAVFLPITEEARQTANHFADLQSTPEKAALVRLNTLAVIVTHHYCQMMGIATDLEQSDSWTPLMQMMGDVADLLLPDIGRLECRPVPLGMQSYQVPPEVWDLRIGYLAIALNSELTTAQLLGFSPRLTNGELSLNHLQSLEELVDHIHTLQQTQQESTLSSVQNFSQGSVTLAETITDAVINLSQWFDETLDQTLESGWQAVDSLLSSNRVAFSIRGDAAAETGPTNPSIFDIGKAKLIDLALQLETQQCVLLVELKAESADTTHIGVQVHPANGQPYLPAGLELAVLSSVDNIDTVFSQVESRQADDYIQLQFNGTSGEQFKIRMQLNQAEYIETFIV